MTTRKVHTSPWRAVAIMLKMLSAIAGLYVTTGVGYAQSPPDDRAYPELTGAMTFVLVVLPLSDDAKACGVTERFVRDAFMRSARGAKFSVAELTESLGGDLHKSVNFLIGIDTQRLDNFCASSIDVQVEHNESVHLEYSGQNARVELTLFTDNGVVLSKAEEHARKIEQRLGWTVHLFISAWNDANK